MFGVRLELASTHLRRQLERPPLRLTTSSTLGRSAASNKCVKKHGNLNSGGDGIEKQVTWT